MISFVVYCVLALLLVGAIAYCRGLAVGEERAELEVVADEGGLMARVDRYLRTLHAEKQLDDAHVSRARAVCQEAADLLDHIASLLDEGKLVIMPDSRLRVDKKRAEAQAEGLASLVFDRSSEMRRVKVAHQRGTLRVSLYEHNALSAQGACAPIREGGTIAISRDVR